MSINHSLLLVMPKGRFIEAIRILEPYGTEQTGLYDPQSVLPNWTTDRVAAFVESLDYSVPPEPDYLLTEHTPKLNYAWQGDILTIIFTPWTQHMYRFLPHADAVLFELCFDFPVNRFVWPRCIPGEAQLFELLRIMKPTYGFLAGEVTHLPRYNYLYDDDGNGIMDYPWESLTTAVLVGPEMLEGARERGTLAHVTELSEFQDTLAPDLRLYRLPDDQPVEISREVVQRYYAALQRLLDGATEQDFRRSLDAN